MQTTTAANVRAEMARRRVSQAALAAHLGISQTAMSRRLTSQTDLTVGELYAVAEFLQMPVTALLGDVDAA